MSQATVYEILEEIQQLSAEDRLLLNDLLAQQGDAEWREEAARMRKMVAERGNRTGGD